MKKLEKTIVKWIPERYPLTDEVYVFFDSDGKLNSLGKYLYSDGSYSKITCKNEIDSRVIGSQNAEDMKVIKFLYNGIFNKKIYANSHTTKGLPSIRTGMYGMQGIGGGAYVYWTEYNEDTKHIEVHRQAYYQNMEFPRYIVDEVVCWYDKASKIHFVAMQENVKVRKTRSDFGKTHNTEGKVTKSNEILSENKRRKNQK